MVIAGPPCQPWSRANRKAKGFRDSRSETFRAVAMILREAMALSAQTAFMVETVEVATHI